MLGIGAVGGSPEQFAEQIKADLAKYATVAKQADIRIE